MGEQHVSITSDENGYVISIGDSSNQEIFETCIICGKKTDVLINTHIDYRYGYVEGAGQCCRECYDRTNNTRNDDYVSKVMRNRTTLITISAEDILNTPNDMLLGEKVRRLCWETLGLNKSEIKQNNFVCTICGKDTSDVDYDYLMGTDHIQCLLQKETENK